MKLLLIGDTAVGKTSILLRYIDDSFQPVFISTIGIDFKVKTIELDGIKIRLQIWDTAGQERYKSVASSYFRSAMGVFFVYDITSKRSFTAMQTWLKDTSLRTETQQGAPVVKFLIGNKCDMEGQRVIDHSVAEKFAADRDMKFFEVSARDNINIKEAFLAMAREIKRLRVDPMSLGKKQGAEGQTSNEQSNPSDTGQVHLYSGENHQASTSTAGKECAC